MEELTNNVEETMEVLEPVEVLEVFEEEVNKDVTNNALIGIVAGAAGGLGIIVAKMFMDWRKSKKQSTSKIEIVLNDKKVDESETEETEQE